MEERYLRYKHLNEYYKIIFGQRTLKICVDAGFTCPNRDGKCGKGGCTFCSERGSGEHLNLLPINEQILNHLNSYRGQRAEKFIVYFQNFTNTYVPNNVEKIEFLKNIYDEAFVDDRIVGIEIATRPDCIDEEIAKLIASYQDKYYVCVELGLQTSNDITAKNFNRGYDSKIFTEAVNILRKYNINVVCHIMCGLPGESFEDIKNTVTFINKHDIQGIKVHSCYVVKNTKLENLYKEGKYEPITLEEYLEQLVYIITHISNDIVIHRASGDGPKDLLVAPEWNLHKKYVLNGLDKILKERDLYQGQYYKNSGE